MKLTPYPYQEEAIDFGISRQGSIIADDCGLGKTLVGMEIAKRVRKTETWRCLVLCPPSLVAQWVKAISEQDDGGRLIYSPSRVPVDYHKLNGWIVNDYYCLYNDEVRKRMQKVLWDIIILDEAHRIKNRQSKISKYVRKLEKVRGICLTATPMEKGPVDLWALFNFIDRPKFRGFHGWAAKNIEVSDNYWGGKNYGKPLNKAAFGNKTAEYMVRRTKSAVAPELPARIDVPVKVDMLPAQQKIYNQVKAADDILVQVDDQELLIQNVLTEITRLQQISVDPTLLDFKAKSGKLQWLEEFIDDHPKERIVVFSRFRNVALSCANRYSGDYIIGGDISPGFNEEKFDRVFGTIAAMGEGLNLQRASTAIFLDGHWSTIRMRQAIDRIHRINITEPKTVYLLESCREDIMIYKAIKNKWSVQQLVYNYLHG